MGIARPALAWERYIEACKAFAAKLKLLEYPQDEAQGWRWAREVFARALYYQHQDDWPEAGEVVDRQADYAYSRIYYRKKDEAKAPGASDG